MDPDTFGPARVYYGPQTRNKDYRLITMCLHDGGFRANPLRNPLSFGPALRGAEG
jgi:hypothetical protein